jgi:two-component system KDP operon response regulator KdpE
MATSVGGLDDGAARTARPKVLIADDDELFRMIIKDELLASGYDVIEAADGAQALEALASAADGAQAAPDLVILDVRMPGYSGLGILSVMRRFTRKRPATLVVTAFRDASVDAFATNLGAMRVFHKPVDPEELVAAVRYASVHAEGEPL